MSKIFCYNRYVNDDGEYHEEDVVNDFLNFAIEERGFKPGNEVCFIGQYSGQTWWEYVPQLSENSHKAREVFKHVISEHIEYLANAAKTIGDEYLRKFRELFLAFQDGLQKKSHEKFASFEEIESASGQDLYWYTNDLIDIVVRETWKAYKNLSC